MNSDGGDDDKVLPVSQQQSVNEVDTRTQIIFSESDFDPVYLRKAQILNDAIQEIGMGKYQWGLFAVLGFGWLADTLWPLLVLYVLSAVEDEFKFNGQYLILGQHVGMLAGVIFWGLASDIWGRRVSFNITLAITGVFALASTAITYKSSRSWITLVAFAAVRGFGVGGNLPVDTAIFLEFVPQSHQYLLSTLSIWWSTGSFIASLVSWPLIKNFSCTPSIAVCNREDNSGWRYDLFAMGGIMLLLWGIRFFAFKLYETPKFLMGYGKDEQAVASVQKVATYNETECSLTVEMLKAAEVVTTSRREPSNGSDEKTEQEHNILQQQLHHSAVVAKEVTKSMFSHVKALFETRKLAWMTTNLIIVWALVGCATALYSTYLTTFLLSRGANLGDGSYYLTYRNQIILAVIGLPGAILAGMLVQVPFLGRKRTMSIAAILTGIFAITSTLPRSQSATFGLSCAYTFTSNIMLGVFYALTAELFPTKARGTGNAVSETSNRIFGIVGAVLTLHADVTKVAPVYVSGVLFIVAGFVILIVPFEPRGKASA